MCKRWLPEVFPAVLVYGIPLMSFGRDITCRPWPLLNLPLRQKEQGLRPSQGILPTQQRAHSKRPNFQPRQESDQGEWKRFIDLHSGKGVPVAMNFLAAISCCPVLNDQCIRKVIGS